MLAYDVMKTYLLRNSTPNEVLKAQRLLIAAIGVVSWGWVASGPSGVASPELT